MSLRSNSVETDRRSRKEKFIDLTVLSEINPPTIRSITNHGTHTPDSCPSMPVSIDVHGSESVAQIPKLSLLYQTAVSTIERAWIRYRDRQMFKLLKHSVCAAENSLSYEILRKVSPREAQLLNDKCQHVRVRFRFGGEEFPPMIFFKIFIHSGAQKVKYISGHKMIKPATEAAIDSLQQMGSRKFYEQMLQDILRHKQCSVNDEVDITTLKDCMQYLSNLDESPAYLGGKENWWRKLTLDDLPRHTIFFDVVDFAYNNHLTRRLKKEIPLLLSHPVTQEVQVQHIQAISKMRPSMYPYNSSLIPKSKSPGTVTHSGVPSRQSKQARYKALKMKQLYSRENAKNRPADCFSHDGVDTYYNKCGRTGEAEDIGDEGEDWDAEANKLYKWTQELSFNDEIMQVP